jgi:hypothetical protein
LVASPAIADPLRPSRAPSSSSLPIRRTFDGRFTAPAIVANSTGVSIIAVDDREFASVPVGRIVKLLADVAAGFSR